MTSSPVTNSTLYGNNDQPIIKISRLEFMPRDGSPTPNFAHQADLIFWLSRSVSLPFDGLNEEVRVARRAYGELPAVNESFINILEADLLPPSWMSIRMVGKGGLTLAYDNTDESITLEQFEAFAADALVALGRLDISFHVTTVEGQIDQQRVREAALAQLRHPKSAQPGRIEFDGERTEAHLRKNALLDQESVANDTHEVKYD